MSTDTHKSLQDSGQSYDKKRRTTHPIEIVCRSIQPIVSAVAYRWSRSSARQQWRPLESAGRTQTHVKRVVGVWVEQTRVNYRLPRIVQPHHQRKEFGSAEHVVHEP